jgi:hypothetical protein
MLSSGTLDVAIGMIFTFLAFSLFISSLVEVIASMLKWRSNSLQKGVRDLLNDPKFTGLAMQLYNHALINPRQPGMADKNKAPTSSEVISNWRKRPAYINAAQFADALIDIVHIAGDDKKSNDKDAPSMKTAIDNKVKDPQLNDMLTGVVVRAKGDLKEVHQALADWFDNAMDRVGGAYKRRTQLCGFVLALIIAAILNVSAINIGRTLWLQPMLAQAISPQLTKEIAKTDDLTKVDVSQTFDTLAKFNIPIGWKREDIKNFYSGGLPCLALIAGWLIVAVTTLFGAPFWFDALQQIIRLKGAGPSPAEKTSKTAAEA